MKKVILSFTAALAWLTPWAYTQILVGPDGAGPFTFDLEGPRPSIENGWSSLSIPGAAGDIITEDALDAAVINNTDVAAITVAIDSNVSVTYPPSQNATARWNTNATQGYFLQTRPTGNNYLLLLATLQNDSGAVLSSVVVSYNWDQRNNKPVNEQVPGHRAFWSLTGLPGSWTLIPEFSVFTVNSGAQTLTAFIPVGSWDTGDRLYIVWADDNGAGGTTDPMEGAYTIDNFTVLTSVTTGVRISSPADNASVVEGAPVPISVSASPDVTSVEFLVDGSSVGTDPTPPFGISVPGLTLGSHTLTAIGTTAGGPVTSDPVHITVNPPSVAILTPTNNPCFLVGTPVTNLLAIAVPGTITAVVYSIDGALIFTNTGAGLIYESSLAGNHTIDVEVTDSLGTSVSASASFSVYDPSTPPYVLLVTNGSDWRYYNNVSEPPIDGNGLAWNQPGYDDETWAVGFSTLGNGDDGENRPKRTPIDIGPDTARYITFYYRRAFSVADPGLFTNLVLRVENDDGAVVYINGLEVGRFSMPVGPVDYNTLGVDPGDDGRFFHTMNIDLVNGPQGNPLEEINSIAVEIHQVSATSSDTTFDLMLWGESEHTGQEISIARATEEEGLGKVVIIWDAYAFPTAIVQGTGTLESDPNLTVWTTVVGTGCPGRIVVPADSPHQFFRLSH